MEKETGITVNNIPIDDMENKQLKSLVVQLIERQNVLLNKQNKRERFFKLHYRGLNSIIRKMEQE